MGASAKLLTAFWNFVGKLDNKRIASKPYTEGVETICNLVYKQNSLHKYHMLDIYRPKDSDKPLPVILDVHGGSWMYGDKEINKHFCMYLAWLGFAVINISYRLAPEATVPMQIADIFDAVSFAYDNKDTYLLDTNNFFVCGDSAGGHLAMLTAIVNSSEELCEKFKVKKFEPEIKALGLSCSAFDLDFLFKLSFVPLAKQMLKYILGTDYKNSEYKQDVSFKYALEKHKLPPVYLNSSKQDFMLKQTLAFKDLLEKYNLPHKVRIWGKLKEHKLPHVYNITNPEYKESIITNTEMCDYFKSFITV